jgi:hypothetical protein
VKKGVPGFETVEPTQTSNRVRKSSLAPATAKAFEPKSILSMSARDIKSALEAGWTGFEIGERIPLAEIARAHELVDDLRRSSLENS